MNRGYLLFIIKNDFKNLQQISSERLRNEKKISRDHWLFYQNGLNISHMLFY